MKILFATDGSDSTHMVEAMLLTMPRVRQAEIHVVSVVPTAGLMMPAMQPAGSLVHAQQAEMLWKSHHEHAQHVVDQAAERLRAADLQVTSAVLDGDVGATLLDYAKQNEITLIAVGSRGHSAFQAFFLGSVARRMLAYADTSVLVVRDREDCPPEEAKRRIDAREKLNLVVGVDGSKGAQLALDYLTAAGPGAYAHAVVCCAEPLSILPPGMDPVEFGRTYGTDHEEAVRIVEEAKTALSECCDTVEGVARLARAPQLMFDEATRTDADLIAIGATRQGFVERFLIGSISFEVATGAPCAVLVVRP